MTRDDQLIRMANQIGRAFEAYPETEAVAAIRRHLLDFWDPAMRARLQPLVADDRLAAAVRRALAAMTPAT
jgi:formate dehydrogenase subunit delta